MESQSKSNPAKLLVKGYIRSIQALMKHIIPEDIILICILFYPDKEYFAKAGWSYVISSDKLCMTRVTHEIDGDGSVIGNIIIPANIQGNHIWKFRIANGIGNIHIGIISNKYDDCDKEYQDFTCEYGTIEMKAPFVHRWSGWNSNRDNTPFRFRTGDIITMQLTATREYVLLEISNQNDRTAEIIVTQQNEGNDWRMFIMAQKKYAQMKLLSYQADYKL